ncbi:MAG: recombination mediator RecR [bacterium]
MAISLIPQPIQRLIEAFEQLPGVGPKTAQRLVFYLLRTDRKKTEILANAAGRLFDTLRFCKVCNNFSEHEVCGICSNPQRDTGVLCVVSEAFDVVAIEKMGQFRGVYHVLQGVLSPLEGIGPEVLTISQLVERVREQEQLREIIFATNPTLEGEATAMYIARLLKSSTVKMTRIARGLPTGGDLEYADTLTLLNAMDGRKEFGVEV